MANNLINFYKTGVSMPQLKEGKYKATLMTHVLNTDKPENPYITLEFKTTEGRVIKENRFNQGFQIFISHLKQQLNRADEEIEIQAFLDELVKDKTEITIWITKYTPPKGGQTRSNLHFLEPRKQEESTITVEDNKPEEEVTDAI